MCVPKSFSNKLVLGNRRVSNNVLSSTHTTLAMILNAKVLNAADYSVPQRRHRLFIIGSKTKADNIFPTPVSNKVSVKKALDGLSVSKVYPNEKYEYVKLLQLIPPSVSLTYQRYDILYQTFRSISPTIPFLFHT